MTSRTSKTWSDAIDKFLSVHYSKKIAIKRSYDNWFVKQMFADRNRRRLALWQKLDLVEHQKYGSDLAVSKFVIGRCSGQIRDGHGKWIKRQNDLPPDHSKSFKVTAIKVASSRLLTEGVDNFVGLEHLESLDLSQNPGLDDFACDQLSRQFRKSKTLNEINLSHNPFITVYGLEILFRIPSIRKIIAIETQAASHEEIDLFTLAAEDERQCEVLVHRNGRQYILPELEDLKIVNTPQIISQ